MQEARRAKGAGGPGQAGLTTAGGRGRPSTGRPLVVPVYLPAAEVLPGSVTTPSCCIIPSASKFV